MNTATTEKTTVRRNSIPANETYPLSDAMTHCITLDESKRRIEEIIHQHSHVEA